MEWLYSWSGERRKQKGKEKREHKDTIQFTTNKQLNYLAYADRELR